MPERLRTLSCLGSEAAPKQKARLQNNRAFKFGGGVYQPGGRPSRSPAPITVLSPISWEVRGTNAILADPPLLPGPVDQRCLLDWDSTDAASSFVSLA